MFPLTYIWNTLKSEILHKQKINNLKRCQWEHKQVKQKKNDIYVMYDKEMTLSFDYNIEP